MEEGVTIEDFSLLMMMSMSLLISTSTAVSMEKLGGSLMFSVLITATDSFQISTSDFNFRFASLGVKAFCRV